MSEDRERPLQKSHLSLVEITHPSKELECAPPLKSVISKGISAPIQKSGPSPRHYFTAEIRKRSPYDFVMVARDPFHYLHCELPLTFEEDQEGGKRRFSLVCQFPTISDDELVDFIDEDETLLGMTLIQFQMQILKNLFLFCAAHNATNLIIKTTEDQLNALGIYKDFIKHVDKIPAKKGTGMEITLPVCVNGCSESIDDITEQFRKTLWQDYSSNPAIRNYLAANVRFSVVAETSRNPSDDSENRAAK